MWITSCCFFMGSLIFVELSIVELTLGCQVFFEFCCVSGILGA